MQPIRRLAVAFLLMVSVNRASGQTGWAFLKDQTHCRLQCQNNGVCAYDVREPAKHKCICMIDMFEGELCQYKVGSTTTAKPTIAVNEDPAYEEETEFHTGPNDLHYSEYDTPANDELHRHNAQDDFQHSQTTGDEYAEFEPKTEDAALYHEAVLAPTEKNSEENGATRRSTVLNTRETAWNSMASDDGNQNDDELFDDEESSWMVYKRRANGAPAASSICLWTAALLIGWRLMN